MMYGNIPEVHEKALLDWERDSDEWDLACDTFNEIEGLRRVVRDNPGWFLGGKRPYVGAVRSAVEVLIDVAENLYSDGHKAECYDMCELLWAACGGREERFNDLFCDHWDHDCQCWDL